VFLGLRSRGSLRPRLVWTAPLALVAFRIRVCPCASMVKLCLFNTLLAIKNILNYFGPWTADVQGPLLNSCVMKVVMTALAGRPGKIRRVGVLACRLPHHPGGCPILPGAHRPEPRAPLLSPYIALNRPIEILNAAPKGTGKKAE